MKKTIAGRLDRRGNFHWGEGKSVRASYGTPNNVGVRVRVGIGRDTFGATVGRNHVGQATLSQVRG